MSKRGRFPSFRDAVLSHKKLNERTHKKLMLKEMVAELHRMIDAGEVSEQAFSLLKQAFMLVLGETPNPSHGIDLRLFQALIEQDQNLEYLRGRVQFFRLLCKNEFEVRDFIARDKLPDQCQKFTEYLKALGRIPFLNFLSMPRDHHYTYARSYHLVIDDPFLDDLDAMFQKMLGISLESSRESIIDECDIQIGYLKAAIRLTRQVGD